MFSNSTEICHVESQDMIFKFTFCAEIVTTFAVSCLLSETLTGCGPGWNHNTGAGLTTSAGTPTITVPPATPVTP